MRWFVEIGRIPFSLEITMLKNFAFLVCSIMALFLVTSCTESPSTPPANDAVSDNRIEGRVFLFDSHANPVTDASGVVVSLVSTSKAEYLDTTTADGAYSISDVPSGYYTVTATHPDYNGPSTHYAFYHSRDLQYVGAGVLSVSELALSAPMSSTIVSNLNSQVSWKYVTTKDAHTGIIDTTDVLAELAVSFEFEHSGTLTEPIITLAEAADAGCEAAVLKPVWITERDTTDGVRSYYLNNFFKDLRSRFGQDVYTKQFYLQVRPKCVVKESGSLNMVSVCLSPVSVSIQFRKP